MISAVIRWLQTCLCGCGLQHRHPGAEAVPATTLSNSAGSRCVQKGIWKDECEKSFSALHSGV